MTETETTAADPEAISEVLRGYLVRCGNSRSRAELAERIVGEGMTVDRLRLLCETLEGRGKAPAETAAMIGQILKPPGEGWQEFVTDLEFAVKARSTRRIPGQRGSGRMVNMPRESQAELARQAELELREFVIERVNVDGKPPAEVAKGVNRTLAEITALLAEVEGGN